MNKKMGVLLALLVGVVIVGGGFAYLTYGSGTLIVEVRDPPDHWGPASCVYVHYSRIMIHRADAGNESGWYMAVENDGWIDLSEVLNASRAIGGGSLRAGKYNLVRFEIIDSVVTVEGQNHTTPVESGKLTVSITRGGVSVEVGQTKHLVIDIAPKVVGSTANGFRLVPAAKASPA
jgi:hypothetical protein